MEHIANILTTSISAVLITSILAGCSASSKLSQDDLNTLSNDEICRSLGRFNDEGGFVLKIYDELKKRAETVDSERCLALEIKARKDSNNEKKLNAMDRKRNSFPSFPSPGLSEEMLNELGIKSKDILRNPLPYINNQEFDEDYNYHESYNIHW